MKIAKIAGLILEYYPQFLRIFAAIEDLKGMSGEQKREVALDAFDGAMDRIESHRIVAPQPDILDN